MDKQRKKVRMTLLRVIETLIDIIVLAFALQLLQPLISYADIGLDLFFTVFVLSTCAYVLSAIRAKEKHKIYFIKDMAIAGAYFVITMLIVLIPESSYLFTYVFVIYALTIIYTRIIRMIKKHKPWNIVLNVLSILFWMFMLLAAFYGLTYQTYLLMVLCISIPIQMLVRVTVLSFSHIRYDILVKVLRKSMAPEILSGLMILIVSFSFALNLYEPAIETYFDALWYCFAIVTTIGFGDITAVTHLGRVLSVILGLYGIIVVALITSVIVNFYTELNKEPSASGEDKKKSAPDSNKEKKPNEKEAAVATENPELSETETAGDEKSK